MSASIERFHLEFIDNNIGTPFVARLNTYTRELYATKGKPCPLTCCETSTAVKNGKTHVSVRFSLEPAVVDKYFEVNLAGPELCELMFATPCRSALDIFKSTVLGITPVNSDWKVYFTTAYLSQSMVEGSAFAREIGQTLKEEYYPPTWVLSFLGTLALGFSFRAFLQPKFQGTVEVLREWNTPETRDLLSQLLGFIQSRRSERPAHEIRRDWSQHAEQLDARAMVYITALKSYASLAQVSIPSSAPTIVEQTDDDSMLDDGDLVLVEHNTAMPTPPVSATPSHALTKAYYNIMETFISFATSNKELLTNFTDAREISKTHLGVGVAGFGMSVAAGCGSMTSFVAGQVVSASMFTPGTLAALGVTGLTGAIEFLVPITLCTNPMLGCGALAGVVASIGCLAFSNRSRTGTSALIKCCKQIHDFLHAAYAEAWLSNTLITLAHCADGVNLESADPTTRRKWKAFAKKLGHGQILDMSKADVEAQLRDRADTLQGFRLDMRQAVLDLTTQMTQASKT